MPRDEAIRDRLLSRRPRPRLRWWFGCRTAGGGNGTVDLENMNLCQDDTTVFTSAFHFEEYECRDIGSSALQRVLKSLEFVTTDSMVA